jgi:hypothetical protein
MRFEAGILHSATYSAAILREDSLSAFRMTATFSGPRPACAAEASRHTARKNPVPIFSEAQ